MKYFSKPTIAGLTLGTFLIGYTVFAYQAPTQAPPLGNVAAPINTSSGFQEKAGDLWVRALGATAGVTIGGQSVCLANGTNCPPSGVPSGFVGFFNLASCPSGWSDLTSAQGRYVVGKPSVGMLGAAVGTALADQENRAVGQHTHSINDPSHGHAVTMRTHLRRPYDNDNQQFGSVGADSPSSVPTTLSATGISVNAAGSVAGTNAPYIQFLVCQKN